MLLTDFIKRGTASLEVLYPTKEAHNIVLILCSNVLGTKNYTHIVEPEFVVPEARIPELEAKLSRLTGGEPIQYVVGYTEFCGYEFKVTPDVLIPRPETELLVREAVKIASRIQRMRLAYGKKAKPVRILDLCTGSGCIAWSVALSLPGVEVIGLDISEAALEVAKSQDFSALLKSSGAIAPQFIKGDILQEPAIQGKFDLILSNPPYIMEKEKSLLRKNVRDFEPESALFVPDDDPLVFYRAIAHWSTLLMEDQGIGLTEINDCLGPETKHVFSGSGFTEVEAVKDFYEKSRFVFYKK
ncbi:MAG: peptide chain release factor N(5)-glutamine methyltransferase [Bacteroidales bacterium]|nr:peptide chain release factor N(5)-glutamine methyltransferase [Bacteroidales bacterium]